jgi:hypothetical protein
MHAKYANIFKSARNARVKMFKNGMQEGYIEDYFLKKMINLFNINYRNICLSMSSRLRKDLDVNCAITKYVLTFYLFIFYLLSYDLLKHVTTALWKPFQFFLLGMSHSVVHFSVFNILQ